MSNTFRVSFIVPAYNAVSTLPRCLEALMNDADEQTEIIVVDDASPDDSAALARRYGVKVIVLDTNSGPGITRNMGAAQAQGDILVFVDSDVEIKPGTRAQIIAFFDQNPKAASVFGSYDDSPSSPGVVSQYRNLLHHYVHQASPKLASHFWGGLGAVRATAFWAVGGFANSGPFIRKIEDVEFGYRLRDQGYEIYLDKSIQGKHLKGWSLYSMIRTDVLIRALPWTKLVLERKIAPNDFSLSWPHRLSVLLSGLIALALLSAPFAPSVLAIAAVALLIFVALNLHLFRFFATHGGIAFAAMCVGLHVFYNFYTGVSFAIGLFRHTLMPKADLSVPKTEDT